MLSFLYNNQRGKTCGRYICLDVWSNKICYPVERNRSKLRAVQPYLCEIHIGQKEGKQGTAQSLGVAKEASAAVRGRANNPCRISPTWSSGPGPWQLTWPYWWWCTGVIALDFPGPYQPLLFSNVSNCFTFILGRPFLLPQRANNGKGEFSQLEKWMRQRGLSAWGNQTGPFAVL